jgi:superfamily II DNA or RNA helicase
MNYNFTHDSKYVKDLVNQGFFDNIQSYQELDDKICELGEKEGNWQEGMAFELFVEALINVEYEQYKSYLHHSKIPQKTKDEWRFPVAKKKEYGIDAIAYENNNTVPIPIQIKFQSKKTKIIWEKLKSLFSAAQKFPYGRRLIVHNQVKIDDALPKDSYFAIGRKELDKLDPCVFEKISKWLKGTPVENLKTELEYRDYQDDECVPQIREQLTKSDRTLIHAVQASGKTVMVIKCILDLISSGILKQNMNAVIVLPSRQLVSRWLNPVLKWIPSVNLLPICTPEELQSEEASHQSITDTVKISQWLKDNNNTGVSICLVTQNSYPAYAEAVKLSGINKIDFGCADEAHNFTGLLTQRKTFFVQDSVLEISKRIFASGTFLIRENPFLDNRIVSMENVDFFGEKGFTYIRKKAIDEGMICPHKRWYSVNVSDLDVDDQSVEFEGESFRSDWQSSLLACKHFVEGPERNVKHCIVTHNKCPRSNAFASDTSIGIKAHIPNVWTGVINGNMSLNEKEAVIAEFQKATTKLGYERAFLCLVACGLEGMDIPKADGLWFADPKKSHIVQDQVTGRVERLFEGKKLSHIGMPIHLKSIDEESVIEAAQRTGYETMVNRYNVMDMEDFDGTVTLIQDELITRSRGYRRDRIGEEIPEITTPDVIPDKTIDQLREALITREYERRYPTHFLLFEQFQDLYKEKGSWEFLLDDNWAKSMPELRSFRYNLIKLSQDENSAYSNYLPWLVENNFPFGTGAELEHELVFVPNYNKLKNMINDGIDWRKDPDTIAFVKKCGKSFKAKLNPKRNSRKKSDRYKGEHSENKKAILNKSIKMLDDLLGPEWINLRLLNFKMRAEEVLNDPHSERSKAQIVRYSQKREKFQQGLVPHGKEKFKIIDNLFNKLGISWKGVRCSKHTWTKEENKILKDNWETTSDKVLSQTKLKGITTNKIALQRKRLGLIKGIGYKNESEIINKAIESDKLMIEKTWAFYKENGNTLHSESDTDRKTGLFPKNIPKDVKRFLNKQRKIHNKSWTQREIANKRKGLQEVIPSTKAALDEMNFVWNPAEKEILIKEYPYEKNGKRHTSYRFSLTIDGEFKTYGRSSLENAKAVLSKIMETGKHLKESEIADKQPKWTDEENKIIKDNWKTKSDEEIHKLIPRRNARSICTQRSKLGFAKKVAKVKWEDHEITILRNNYKKMTDKEMSQSLLKSKTRKQITGKRLKMGFKK